MGAISRVIASRSAAASPAAQYGIQDDAWLMYGPGTPYVAYATVLRVTAAGYALLFISDDASRYYKSGKGFLYRNLPFWLATLTDRVVPSLFPNPDRNVFAQTREVVVPPHLVIRGTTGPPPN